MSDCETWRQRAAALLENAHPPTRKKGWDWRVRRDWHDERRRLLEEAEKKDNGNDRQST